VLVEERVACEGLEFVAGVLHADVGDAQLLANLT
jgi:hypothetical protein